MIKRWNGGGFFIAGFVSLGLAVALYFFAANMNTSGPVSIYGSDVDRSAIVLQLRLIIFGHGFIGLGVFLIAIGCVIRAIWFLPGDEEKALPARVGIAWLSGAVPRDHAIPTVVLIMSRGSLCAVC